MPQSITVNVMTNDLKY